MPFFAEFCAEENANSMTVCQNLSSNIIFQNSTLVPEHVNTTYHLRRVIASKREARYKFLLDNLRSNMNDEQIRGNDLAQMKVLHPGLRHCTKDTIKFVTYLQLRSMKLPMMCQRNLLSSL